MPKTKEQFEQIKRERIKSIYDAALYLFAVRGFDGVTSDQITTAARCSHGLMYHYFGSKEILFKELIDNVADKLDQEITSKVNFNQKAKFLIIDLLDAYLNALNSSRDDYACAIYLLLNLYIQSKYTPKLRKGFKFNIFDNFYKTIEQGKKDGDFKDYATKDMTIVIISTLKGLSYNRIHLGYKHCTIPKSEMLMELILKK